MDASTSNNISCYYIFPMAVTSIANKARACIADKGTDVTIVFSNQITLNVGLQSIRILTDKNFAAVGVD